MIILNSTPQDKGSQLETLTKGLLGKWGYIECETNVFSNGSEVDVRGKFIIPPSGRRTAICECKAQQKLVDMTQWDKFLGKIYFQEAIDHTEVVGCFVSLDGVNGYVRDNFEALEANGKNVTLLHGEKLEKEISDLIPFRSLKEIRDDVSRNTQRIPIRFELAYHNGKIYWIVVFSDHEFTLIDSRGAFLDANESEILCEMVKSEMDVSEYIDILKEQLAQVRKIQARSFVIGMIFENEGKPTELQRFDDFTIDELNQIASELAQESVLSIDNGTNFSIPKSSSNGVEWLSTDVYRILLDAPVLPSVLKCDFYQRHVNEKLLESICEIQGNLTLTDDVKDEVLFFLKLSPTALKKSLSPMKMILNGRASKTDALVDAMHSHMLSRACLAGLWEDFRDQNMRDYFYTTNDILEIQTVTTFQVKSSKRCELKGEANVRTRIGRLAPELGGALIMLEVSKDAPEPWEHVKPD